MRLLTAILLTIALGACSAATPAPSWQYPAGSPVRSSLPSAPASSPSAALPTAQASLGADGIRSIRADVARAAGGNAGGSDAQRVVAGDTALATRVYQELAAEPGNFVYSPYSIGTALSITYGGARARTADQLAAALGIEAGDAGPWHRGRNDLDLWLERPIAIGPGDEYTPLTIEPTNALFWQDGFAFEPDYLELLARDYGAGLQTLDFAADPDAARAAINRRVATQTKDRIRELLAKGTIDDSTRFVLVNAIFFKASWVTPFDPALTTSGTFHRVDSTTVAAPTMHGTIDGDYERGDGWQMVAILYAGGQQ
jgi:serpin B